MATKRITITKKLLSKIDSLLMDTMIEVLEMKYFVVVNGEPNSKDQWYNNAPDTWLPEEIEKFDALTEFQSIASAKITALLTNNNDKNQQPDEG